MKKTTKKETVPEFGKIIKGATMPKAKSSKHPFDKMQVGDSFIAGEYSKKTQQSFNGSGQWFKRKTGNCFSTRKVQIGEKFYLQVWRTK